MTPLMLSTEVNNFAFLVELPVETVFSDNEDIQTIQIDECSPLSSSAVNNVIQPMLIASTDSQGNCFVTLQDEQNFNSCNTWNSQSEVTATTPTVVPATIAVSRASVPTTAKVLRTKASTVSARPGTVAIKTTTAATLPTAVSAVVLKKSAESGAKAVVNTSNILSASRRTSVTSQAKTDLLSVTNAAEMPTITRILNSRQAIGLHSYTRCGRSRMIADNLTSIPVPEFKAQLNDTSDIIGKLDLAPPTKRRMNLLQWKGIGKLFASPGQKFMSRKLMKIFTRNLRTRLLESEETFSDMELLPIGYKPEVDPTKIKRITRRRRYPEAEEYQRRMLQEQMEQTLQNLVAGGQAQIQTVYLDNAEFKDQSQEAMQVLIESAENGSYTQTEQSRVVDIFGNDHASESSIIVIHNSQDGNHESAYTQQNIEVLLAAAGESGLSGENISQVIICNTENSPESVLPCASSIIIVPNDTLSDTITETVVST